MKFFIYSEEASSYLLQLNAFGNDPLTRSSKHLDSCVSTRALQRMTQSADSLVHVVPEQFRDLYLIQRQQNRDATTAKL